MLFDKVNDQQGQGDRAKEGKHCTKDLGQVCADGRDIPEYHIDCCEQKVPNAEVYYIIGIKEENRSQDTQEQENQGQPGSWESDQTNDDGNQQAYKVEPLSDSFHFFSISFGNKWILDGAPTYKTPSA